MAIRFLERLKSKHYIQCGLTILLTGIFLFLTSSLWSSKNIVVSFDAEAVKDIGYQLFYIEEKGEGFKEITSIRKTAKAGKSHIEIAIPIKKLIKFRLDIGSQPGKVLIKNIKLLGMKTIKPNCNEFSKNQIDSYNADNDLIILFSDKNDPYIVYKPELDLVAGMHVDRYVLIIFATLSFLFFYKLVKYLAKFKIDKNYSRIDIVMLTVFFGMLWLPMSYISDAEKSEQENRMLAKYYPLWQNNKFNYQYGENFEKWYNDRFLGRDIILTFYNKLKYYIAPFSGNNKVLIGKDGWLFFKLEKGFENFANVTELTENNMKNGLKYLKGIDEWCKKNGKEFYYVIAPDKSKIYGEYYRLVKKQRSDEKGIGYQFSNYIKKNSDIKVLYLRDELLKNKDKGLLYYKHDTHWSHLGAYYGYKALVKLMNIPEKTFDFTPRSHDGDLNMMTNYVVEKDMEQYQFVKIKKYCEEKGNSITICNYFKGNRKLFMLRDSFAGALIPYLSYSFSKISTHHYIGYNFSKENLKFLKDNADIIILENVERNIPSILNKTFPQNIKD